MNITKTNNKSTKPGIRLRKLSLSIGSFISYWGFRRVHGAIWTQLYLSRTPLSCADLTRKLGLSKALISPALSELCHHKLIREAPAPNEKTKLYQASDDINEVIKHVLESRERVMLKQISQDFLLFKKNESESEAESLDKNRMQYLEDMISSAKLMLEIMIAQGDLANLPRELEK